MFYFQLVIMAGTILLAYYFEYTDTFPVHIQGFFCYDKTFSKPYPGPEESSRVPPVLVYSLVTAIPAVTTGPQQLQTPRASTLTGTMQHNGYPQVTGYPCTSLNSHQMAAL
ncbi:Lipid phosphate phosphatase-related protein type 5 [Acipenser ruthenus]|uniref:Lipid phosphate phosphatase-related protein type 5 n=1 Tax=Acipenser ruthenus TaxID=7906 RepID=A0A444US22_ACIRT|nr:Lipid phosphate phosphatase-related protein type 5 [Acipenser ruthenus]